MTISSFELYMILKLDDIHNALSILVIPLWAFCILSAIGFILWFAASIPARDNNDDIQTIQTIGHVIKKTVLVSFGVLFVVMLLQTIIPTTRQMASILVVPAIVNSNFVQKELPSDLKEIYTLAKEGMTKALSDKKDDKNE